VSTNVRALAVAFLFLATAACVAKAQEPSSQRQKIPSLSNDDLGERSIRPSTVDPSPSTGVRTGTPAAWRDVPAALAKVSSFRARILNALPNPQADITLEVSLPDRFHETLGQIEMITVGANSYLKVGNQAWNRNPEGDPISFKHIFARAFDGVRSAKLVGAESIDGIDTNVFEIVSVNREGKPLTQRVWAGKDDALPRKIEQPREGLPPVTMLFSDFNVYISIQPPM